MSICNIWVYVIYNMYNLTQAFRKMRMFFFFLSWKDPPSKNEPWCFLPHVTGERNFVLQGWLAFTNWEIPLPSWTKPLGLFVGLNRSKITQVWLVISALLDRYLDMKWLWQLIAYLVRTRFHFSYQFQLGKKKRKSYLSPHFSQI